MDEIRSKLESLLRRVMDAEPNRHIDFEVYGCLCIKVSTADTDALEDEITSGRAGSSPKFVAAIQRKGIRSLNHFLGNFPARWDADKTEAVIRERLEVANTFEL